MIIPFSFANNIVTTNPFGFIRADVCPYCKARAIEVYDQYNRGIGFTKLLNDIQMNKEVKLYNKVFTRMKCRNCHTDFRIYWQLGEEIPRPLTDHVKINSFVKNNFKTIIKRE